MYLLRIPTGPLCPRCEKWRARGWGLQFWGRDQVIGQTLEYAKGMVRAKPPGVLAGYTSRLRGQVVSTLPPVLARRSEVEPVQPRLEIGLAVEHAAALAGADLQVARTGADDDALDAARNRGAELRPSCHPTPIPYGQRPRLPLNDQLAIGNAGDERARDQRAERPGACHNQAPRGPGAA